MLRQAVEANRIRRAGRLLDDDVSIVSITPEVAG